MPTPHAPAALAVEDLVIPQGATEGATWPTPWIYAEGEPPDDLGPPTGWDTDGGIWTARLQIRDHRGAGSVLLATLSSDIGDDPDGSLILDTVTEEHETYGDIEYARITPEIPVATSSAWTWEAGEWDLEITNGSRTVRLVEGHVALSGEVTLDG